jgi:hypothetical protein
VLALAERVKGNKGLCREITSDDASKKTSLLQHYNSYSKLSKLGTWKMIQRLSLYSFPNFLLFIFFLKIYFLTCNKGKQKHAVEKE